MKKSHSLNKPNQSNQWESLSGATRRALEILIHIDVPAKGRIAHHIRTGRLHRALELCEAGKLSIWKRLDGKKPIQQKFLWIRLQRLLRTEAGPLPFPSIKGFF